MNKSLMIISCCILLNTCCSQLNATPSLSDTIQNYFSANKYGKSSDDNKSNDINLFADAIKTYFNGTLNNNNVQNSNFYKFFEFFKDYFNPKKDGKSNILTNTITNLSFSIDNVFKIVSPAVVSIFATNKEKSTNENELLNIIDSYFNYNTRGLVLNTGSGFCVKTKDDKLYIATSYSIIKDAKQVAVVFGSNQINNSNIVSAKVHCSDPDNNISVLEIDINDIVKNTQININQLKVDWDLSNDLKSLSPVCAVGNTLGVVPSISSGIILAKTKETYMKINTNNSSERNSIRYSVAITNDYLGGVLVNTEGKIIGIINSMTDNNGIGYAISADTAKSIIDSLIDDNKSTTGWIGIDTQALSVEEARNLGVIPDDVDSKTTNQKLLGAMVSYVNPNSQAYKVGIRPKDILIMFNKVIIDENNPLEKLISECGIGKTASLSVLRKNNQTNKMDQINFDIVVTNYSEINENNIKDLGIDVEERKINNNENQVVVTKVGNDGNTTQLFQEGDIIYQANNENINSIETLKKFVNNFYRKNPDSKITFLVIRHDKNNNEELSKVITVHRI